MSRRYGDPVEVARRDDEPAQFLWRGRLYVVRGVLAHWVEAGAWWRAAPARALYTGEEAASSGLDDGEREVWRVEAGAGRSTGTGVFDLCFDWSAGSWTLARALD
jgi:Family of unknown function (DUF6504)